MNITILTSSPNKNGLTAVCAKAAVEGVELSGAQGFFSMP